ncbi:hypothetical protein L208DRAFT_1414140 [Tricholoma matsutake]|nr:hypothetical protein L208DRAFT_1414140 [Tricholoma matsutake 945]
MNHRRIHSTGLHSNNSPVYSPLSLLAVNAFAAQASESSHTLSAPPCVNLKEDYYNFGYCPDPKDPQDKLRTNFHCSEYQTRPVRTHASALHVGAAPVTHHACSL